ncbi:MAG TPA: polyhydroxyalkanoate depolymerase [Acidisphaera sp.]|nr:polyhydroxyalkanoate depolymerase [Acidisphaera sp.]
MTTPPVRAKGAKSVPVPAATPSLDYAMHFWRTEATSPLRLAATSLGNMLLQFDSDSLPNPFLRMFAGMCDVAGLAGTTHARPDYGIRSVLVGNREFAVVEEVEDRRPFGDLLHFTKPGAPVQPKVLVVAPMSGHFATLLRATVRTMLSDHDVYITDWANARNVPLAAGRFGFAEYVAYCIRWLEKMGGRNHVLAVCQPAVAVLAAVALMSEDMNPALPRSMTLMAGPIDSRISPTRVNDLAKSRTIEWFERKLIETVPWPLAGHGRRVYPGVTQVAAFMSMNLQRHIAAQFTQVRNHIRGERAAAAAHRTFYDEYLAVMDLPAEFYLETVEQVFQRHDLPRGQMMCHGRPVDLNAIRHTFLFTVEGEQDDICAIGQTQVALDLCSRLRQSMKRQHLQTGVGHYGVFSGRRWNQEVYPLVREVIDATTPSGRNTVIGKTSSFF